MSGSVFGAGVVEHSGFQGGGAGQAAQHLAPGVGVVAQGSFHDLLVQVGHGQGGQRGGQGAQPGQARA